MNKYAIGRAGYMTPLLTFKTYEAALKYRDEHYHDKLKIMVLNPNGFWINVNIIKPKPEGAK